MTHRRTCYPRAETNRNRWRPKYIAVYTRVPVNEDDPRERTRQLVQRVAGRILKDNYERRRGEVNLP